MRSKVEDDAYCGFLCSDIIERQKAILDDIDDFSQYNPGFAAIMRFRITQMCLDKRVENVDKTVENIEKHLVST